MFNAIKKYRSDPKRAVLTFSFQKKLTINRLGDLMIKEKGEFVDAYKANKNECYNKQDRVMVHNDYVLEKDNYKHCANALKEKKKQIQIEQAQILEKDNCTRAFRENYHIKPLDYKKNEHNKPIREALKVEREVRGGIVCEKSYKMLLCDLLTLIGAVSLTLCLIIKHMSNKR